MLPLHAAPPVLSDLFAVVSLSCVVLSDAVLFDLLDCVCCEEVQS